MWAAGRRVTTRSAGAANRAGYGRSTTSRTGGVAIAGRGAGPMGKSGFLDDDVVCAWRAPLTDGEMVESSTRAGGDRVAGWWDQIRPHSLGWVTARTAASVRPTPA